MRSLNLSFLLPILLSIPCLCTWVGRAKAVELSLIRGSTEIYFQDPIGQSLGSQALPQRIVVNATPTRSILNLQRRLTPYTPEESLQPERNRDPLDHARLTLRLHILVVVEKPPAWDSVILWVNASIIRSCSRVRGGFAWI